MCSLEILQVAIPIGSRAATVNQKVCAADETSAGGHQELSQVAHFIRRSCTTGGHTHNHLQIAFPTRAMQFIVGQWRDDITPTRASP